MVHEIHGRKAALKSVKCEAEGEAGKGGLGDMAALHATRGSSELS